MDYPDIIPYDSWIHSPLSIARHCGGITTNGKKYTVDWIFAKTEKNGLCKPDLVEEKLHQKMQKERKAEIKAYNDEAKKRAKEKQEEIDSLPF